MRLITWNCQGAFRKKAEVILKYKPDILVVQECEHTEKLIFNSKLKKPNNIFWIGDNPHKGLGIFSYGDYKFRTLATHNPDLKYVLPISVSGGSVDFTLFAIWANNREDKKNQYVGQVWKAISYYREVLLNGLVVLAGDFNSNAIWDRKYRVGNHSDVVDELLKMNIHSIYHHHFKQVQGEERHPTFYLYKDKHKSYHLDYCFTSHAILNLLQYVEVGTFKKWMKYSDHSPLIAEF
jgi:exodeoxyribonuclease-3